MTDAEAQAIARQFVDRLSDEYSTNSHSKDRIVITLSTAALGFSFAFLTDPARMLEPDGLLYGSWLCLGLSIVAVLLSFEMAAFQMRRTITDAHKMMRERRWRDFELVGRDVLYVPFTKKRLRVLGVLNFLSVASLIAGLVLTTMFVWGNL